MHKTKEMPGLGTVRVTKKKGLKRINLRMHHSGEIRVSVPYYLPYLAGFSFAKEHTEWVNKQRNNSPIFKPHHDMRIGLNHRLVFAQNSSERIIVKDNIIKVNMPDPNTPLTHQQNIKIKKAIKRALAIEAEEVLLERTAYLASKYGFNYSAITTKPMKSRWGSCNSKKEIALNIYLMMMPWNIIDYVIVHELAHTKQMNHSPDFWKLVEEFEPNYKEIKKRIKKIQPEINQLYC